VDCERLALTWSPTTETATPWQPPLRSAAPASAMVRPHGTLHCITVHVHVTDSSLTPAACVRPRGFIDAVVLIVFSRRRSSRGFQSGLTTQGTHAKASRGTCQCPISRTWRRWLISGPPAKVEALKRITTAV
ncbi:hypothetical protein F442_10784, partial [Phytophthora nicotianae P10297]